MLAAQTRALLATIRQRFEGVTRRVLTTPTGRVNGQGKRKEPPRTGGRRMIAEEWSHDAQMHF
jgi:hypothetical protein